MKLNRNFEIIKKHIPDILTTMSVIGTIVSDVLFISAAKKETLDGDKKHYILPLITSSGTIACIILSNKVSNDQKVFLLTTSAALATKFNDYRKDVNAVITDEQKETLDELVVMADEAYKDDAAFVDGDKALYYLPQFGIAFVSDQQTIATAELNLNQSFVHDGEASLVGFLREIGVYGMLNPEDQCLINDLVWRFNYDDYDSGMQYITFSQYTKTLRTGRVCNYIEFIQEPQTLERWAEYYGDED